MGIEGFKENVKTWWVSFKINCKPGNILAEKMKLLKGKLKELSKGNKGTWKKQKEELLIQIANLEGIQEQRSLTDDELLQKTNLQIGFEEIGWRQRSRIQ